jgi:hypothetical protein
VPSGQIYTLSSGCWVFVMVWSGTQISRAVYRHACRLGLDAGVLEMPASAAMESVAHTQPRYLAVCR